MTAFASERASFKDPDRMRVFFWSGQDMKGIISILALVTCAMTILPIDIPSSAQKN
ncbi:hypothetical protein ASPWEDRAFT_43429 [Aspergillus wentii DTO 134E9]|uniref:Uncharacterized protein n=1 Tax=Aspergillus wentii DTO 134E9 TaxID=1073089 RepID=A0A1L9REK8_ASPWE|nr:uncharacterized protein ASPWEDRAFT_43429 [Aspergillus wentii DTO 134E9]OJJ33360.1 hypothetical protein ASPWEDRAFT_43429 [Aspergillus wentii DTO 134E9]